MPVEVIMPKATAVRRSGSITQNVTIVATEPACGSTAPTPSEGPMVHLIPLSRLARLVGQRNVMLPVRLHSVRRDRPKARPFIELVPACTACFRRTGPCEGDEPKAERRRAVEVPELVHDGRNARIGRCGMIDDRRDLAPLAKSPVLKVSLECPRIPAIDAFRNVLQRAEMYRHHRVLMEALSVRERMTQILGRVNSENFLNFELLFDVKEGRMGVVVTFMAVLELLKESLLVLVQNEPFAPIHVKAAA